jgi:hypothetical protein
MLGGFRLGGGHRSFCAILSTRAGVLEKSMSIERAPCKSMRPRLGLVPLPGAHGVGALFCFGASAVIQSDEWS